MNLYKKIKTKNSKIGVIGLGYVGLPLAVEKASAKQPVNMAKPEAVAMNM